MIDVDVRMDSDDAIKAAVAAEPGWRELGYRSLDRSIALCPKSHDGDGPGLAGSLRVRFIDGVDPYILIGSELERAHGASALALIHQGTNAHEIVPVKAKALRFKVGGVTVFAKRVQHPGTHRNPFVLRAFHQIVLEAGGSAFSGAIGPIGGYGGRGEQP